MSENEGATVDEKGNHLDSPDATPKDGDAVDETKSGANGEACTLARENSSVKTQSEVEQQQPPTNEVELAVSGPLPGTGGHENRRNGDHRRSVMHPTGVLPDVLLLQPSLQTLIYLTKLSLQKA
ncbi:unnamed protein product [Bemisia tabaci]|uniref:Uncharacterized protein n=1 Tax=Bemisia tabaci TaxID=7038 RepID=A0A9P0AD22_BEMTA|nr:unnamed protein product [Bemisia tabaci]